VGVKFVPDSMPGIDPNHVQAYNIIKNHGLSIYLL